MALSKGHTFTSGEVVTPTKLNNLVDNATIGDGTITTAMIADDAVTADKIATGAVTADALASGVGGASAIDDLTDVDTSSVAPTDGQALVWDNANSKWEPGTVSSGSSSVAAACVFDGTASSISPTITDNVSSVTKNATGDYTVNFTNSISNPVVNATPLKASSSQTYDVSIYSVGSTSVRLITGTNTSGTIDMSVHLIVHSI